MCETNKKSNESTKYDNACTSTFNTLPNKKKLQKKE